MAVLTVVTLLDDVSAGARHRPAFTGGPLVWWSVDKAVRAGLPGGSGWYEYAGLAGGSSAALAVFVVIARLPRGERADQAS